jgi:macrolide-specific efflux system membrane fusion protein
VAVLIAVVGIWYFMKKEKGADVFVQSEIKPFYGDIMKTISTTGVIEPENRLEIIPPINGRIEEMLVKEGDKVKRGDVLAVMSSTDRAALLDAAIAQGKDAVAYWKDVYKETPLISPIDGDVIVRAVEPGQTVTSQTAVLVLSDRLIVKAQVDETDIGSVKTGQDALIIVDAYPDDNIPGTIGHIAYESKTVNNVTIYEVDVIPSVVPDFFRSGMSTTVDIVESEKKNVLMIPVDAVTKENGINTVQVKKAGKIESVRIETGISDGMYYEVLSGIGPEDIVITKSKKIILNKKSNTTNPFMPQRPKKKDDRTQKGS